MQLSGQISNETDTIRINEVVIGGRLKNTEHPGFKQTDLDSSVIVNYNSGNLADLLGNNTGIYIKSYGLGGISTPSFRGTGASHTQIDWNGININSPMLGQTDLSLVPAGFLDDVQIYYGGASMSLNSGGFGGIINVETKPVWEKGTIVSISPSIGSFGRYTGLLKLKSGGETFQTVTRAYFQSSENDFRFLNSEAIPQPKWESRTHNQVHQQGFMEELYLKNSNDVASARIWYQSSQRNLAPPLEMQDEKESQSDVSLRTLLNYNMSRGSSDLAFTGAYLYSNLNYINKLVKIDSRNEASSFVLKASAENPLGSLFISHIVLNEEFNVINTNNYTEKARRNTFSATASLESRGGQRVGFSVLLRETLDRSILLIPDFSAGIQFRLSEESAHTLHANISRSSKIPTLNDMFWAPGGNPDLKNEYAYIYELSYRMKKNLSTLLGVDYELTIFHNRIKDMIQWIPGEYSYWSASNLGKFNTTGLESSVSADFSTGNLASRFSASYSYIPSGKQLVYQPENQAKASLTVSYRSIYSAWSSNLAESGLLPGYFINRLIAGYKLKIKESLFDMNFCIDNLFDGTYQTMAHYPLPGRSYTLKLSVQIAKYN